MKKAIVYVIAFVGLFALAFWLFGCFAGTEYQVKINPATGEGTATLVRAGLHEPISGTQFNSSEVIPVEESGGWWAIAGAALTVVGAGNLLGPRNWPNLVNIFKFGPNSNSWLSAGKSLLSTVGGLPTPPEAKLAVTPAKPDRSHP